ncbi:MAG: restriction endonuclease [Luteibacter sp.]
MKSVRHRHDDALSRVTWGAFEHMVAEHFRRQGYRVEHVSTDRGHGQNDGSIDLKLLREQEIIVVQCKHWNSFQVPHHDVHQLIRSMHTEGATSAMVVTSGEFTGEAIEAAAKFRHIRLIDGKTIRAMLGPIHEPLTTPTLAPDTWISIRSESSTAASKAGRASAIAAVAAVVVMGCALVMLYTFYIHEIQRAQMAALVAAKKPTHAQQAGTATAPDVLPGLAPWTRHVDGSTAKPPVVHGVPTQRDAIAEWNDKRPVSAAVKDE